MKSKRIMILASILVFAAGVAIFANAVSEDSLIKAEPFKVVYKYSKTLADGSTVVWAIGIRGVDEKGNWKEERYNLKSGKTEVFGADQIASYYLSEGLLQYDDTAGPLDEWNKIVRSVERLRKHEEFNREDSVAGLTTYVFRHEESGGFWSERYYSPKTGHLPLKDVSRDHVGGETQIKEAVNIQFRYLLEGEFKLPNLPVSFDRAKKEIELAWAPTNPEIASELRARIEKTKQSLIERGTKIQ